MKHVTNKKTVEDIPTTKEAAGEVNEKDRCFQGLVLAREAAVNTLAAIEKYEEEAEKERKRENSRKTERRNLYSIENMSLRKQIKNGLKTLRQLRCQIGFAVIKLLEDTNTYLSEKEFCDACGLADKYQEVQEMRAMFEKGSEGSPDYYFWLIFEYGVESSDEETKSGPLFECVMHAVKEAIMSDAKLKSKARENMLHIFNAVIA